MLKKLIVNADDFGNSPAVTAGILQAHLEGIVTSTTAMMNMPGAAEQVREGKSRYPGFGLGVHLVLSEGRPLLPPEQVKSITGEKNEFPGLDELLERLDRLNFSEVEKEWGAQIDLFTLAAGCPPDHLDAHGHMAYLHPKLFRVFLDLAERCGCAIRAACLVADESNPENPPVDFRGNLPVLKSMLAERKIPHPQFFIHSMYDEQDFPAELEKILDALPEGISELMCHPGRADETLAQTSTYTFQREKELAALIRPGLKDRLDKSGVKLIRFSDL